MGQGCASQSDGGDEAVRQRWQALGDRAPPAVLAGLLRLADVLPLEALPPSAEDTSGLRITDPVIAAVVAFATALPAELARGPGAREHVEAAAAAAFAALAEPTAGGTAEDGEAVTAGAEDIAGGGAEEGLPKLQLRIVQAMSGSLAAELEVSRTLTVLQLRRQLAACKAGELPSPGVVRLVRAGQVLPDEARLGDLGLEDQAELQLLRVAGPAFERTAWGDGYDTLVKVGLIGPERVGKSCLLAGFAGDDFREDYVSTIGVDFRHVGLLADGGARIKVQVWDTAGEERYKPIVSAYFRGMQGALLVFDFSRYDTFERIHADLASCRRLMPAEVVLGLVGNKADLPDAERAVPEAEAVAFAQREGLLYFSASARSGSCEPLYGLLQAVLANQDLGASGGS